MEDVNRAARNCDGTHPELGNALSFPWVPPKWEGLRMCPWGQIGEEAWALFSVWSDWQGLGLLPYPGGLGEQPPHIVEAIRVVENEVARAKNREVRKARQAQQATKSATDPSGKK